LNVGIQGRFIAGFGFAERVKQQVSNFRHGRYYDGHGALRVLLRGEARGYVDAFGRAHAGPSELHHQKMTTAVQ
jgi:hypothetical protein